MRPTESRIRMWNNGWTRRQFLARVGEAGGAAALYETMTAMGLLRLPSEWSGPPELPQQGNGRSVLILGAGIGGLTTAYVLSKYGYRCKILEAQSRPGGRNFSARRGTVIVEESEENGRTTQECTFDDGLYANLGPARIPYHHRRVLGYCQELGVAMQPFLMNSTGNLFHSNDGFGGEAQPYREVANDTRGYVAELLAKAVNQGALDADLDDGDRQRLLGLLQTFGPLGPPRPTAGAPPDYAYYGSTRTGCAPDPSSGPTPNVFRDCEAAPPAELAELLGTEFWTHSFYGPLEYEWQATLFQPTGGMDKIVDGFVRQVGELITYNAPVTRIEVSDDGVAVEYRQGESTLAETADYCVSSIPCPILTNIDNNFTTDFAEAVRGTKFGPACKVAWQCNTRFWENDRYEIYGGISWTDHTIGQIWYPSDGCFTQKGTLIGAYIFANAALEFGRLSLAERLAVARQGGAQLHSEFNDEGIVPNARALSIARQNIPYLAGAWPAWGAEDDDNEDYRRLLLPDRRFYIVGDQASTLPGWQEGAMMSAEHVIELIGGIKPHQVPDDTVAPNTQRVVRGNG